MDDAFAAGDRFLLSHARLLERRLFAVCYLGQPGSSVADAVRGYQNADGGFGHALEPDTRCPASLPIYVEVALQALATANLADAAAMDHDMVLRACDYLAGVADRAGADGAVPLALPVIESFARAVHWSEWTYEPGLNPTAGLVGLLYALGVDHPWRAAGEAYCWRELESAGLPTEAHALREVLVFLEHVPDTERADKHAAAVLSSLPGVSPFRLDADSGGYGLTPLDFAPLATSRWRRLFDDAQIDAHLDRLLRDQQADGGWPVTWDPPAGAALNEWRGMVTLGALRTLTSYGRLAPST
jgi:hypothetical protein